MKVWRRYLKNIVTYTMICHQLNLNSQLPWQSLHFLSHFLPHHWNLFQKKINGIYSCRIKGHQIYCERYIYDCSCRKSIIQYKLKHTVPLPSCLSTIDKFLSVIFSLFCKKYGKQNTFSNSLIGWLYTVVINFL